MPWYLITDSRGSPFEYPLSAELDPEGITARPGSALETHWIGHKNRAKFQIAPDPLTAATSRAPDPRWPARLFMVAPATQLQSPRGEYRYVYRVEILEEISVFEVFDRKAKTMERVFMALEEMGPEQWVRVAAHSATARVALTCNFGAATTELTRTAVRSYADAQRARLKWQGNLACHWTRLLLRIEKRDASDFERKLMVDSLEAATWALVLGDNIPGILREAALAPFAAVIGPVWENPRRSPAQSPSTSPTSSPQVAQAGGGEGIWPSIS